MDIYPGRVVVSTAGRDKNRYFVVLSVRDNYCYISDGKVRKVDMPKKKKIKHLQVTGFFLEKIANSIATEQSVTNSMIRRSIAEIGQ